MVLEREAEIGTLREQVEELKREVDELKGELVSP
jgi:polyhydroxyalkanoate synthesis regulator phasin